MPASVTVQLCLFTPISLSFTTIVWWSLLLSAMAVPYVFGGGVVSLGLTRSPFPTGLVYGVDLLGAALGCVAVIGVLNVLDGPTSVVLSGTISGLSAMAFAASASSEDQKRLKLNSWWQRPTPVVIALTAFGLLNSLRPDGLRPMRPILVKNNIEVAGGADNAVYERWNSYSRIIAMPPYVQFPSMCGASPKLPSDTRISQIELNIDGMAGSAMFHYDGTRDSISFLQYDLVNLAYRLPGIHKSAVIGVGGGRDLLSAYLLGVPGTAGVEVDP